MADAKEKCIGKLTLDISDVEKKVEAINKSLATLGKNADVKIKIADEVKKQIEVIYNDLQNSSKKITDVAQKTIAEISKIGQTKVNRAAENKELQDTAKHLREYYNLLKQAEQAKSQGNIVNSRMFSDAAEKELAQVNNDLREQAEAYQSVTRARLQYNAVQNKNNTKELSNEARIIEDATKAYIKLEEAKSKAEQLKTQGKQDTAEYAKATKAVNEAQQAYDVFTDSIKRLAEGTDRAKAAMADLANVESAVAKEAQNASYLDQIKQKYTELTDAIKRYKAAKNMQDTEGMAHEQAKISQLMEEVNLIQQAINASDMESKKKQEVLNYIERCVTAEMQHNGEVNKVVTTTNELGNQVSSLLTRYLSLIAVIRMISNLLKNMTEYVSEYSDKMNEIQMITLKTDQEVEQLAKTYRNLANDMSVSSLDMADAAIYFTRQGLGAAEIEKRLKSVTMYAKAANVEFKSASEIITAVVNSMNLAEEEMDDGRNAAQRVSDVFLSIGDTAATSGQEIGEAMQKAAASAGAFGVSLEWLSASIAAVSETTRQEARTIGTAFNTIIARLHQIKQNGYNQEDETKINDVAKALSKIDVALMDQSGQWRDYQDIMNDVASKWDTLDDKTKSYIATTMAGVKQQNVFLAWMENTERVTELYNTALDSTGVSTQKYGVYLDGVAASQERLTVAQETFYSMLDSSVIKDWNNFLAGFINLINEGTEAWNGWNIAIPLIAAGIAGLIVVIKNFSSIVDVIFVQHPIIAAIGLAAASVVALTTALSALASESNKSKELFEEASKAAQESQERISSMVATQSKMEEMFSDLGDETRMTKEELNKYSSTLEQIAGVSPVAKQVVDDLKAGLIDQKEAAKLLREEMEKLIDTESKYNATQLLTKYSNWSPSQSASETFLDNMASWSYKSKDYLTDDQNFARALQHAYLYNEKLPDEIRKEIYDMLDANYERGETYNNEEEWGIIGQVIWQKYVGTNSSTLADALKQKANEAIDEVINSLSAGRSLEEVGALRRMLFSKVFGEDGEISKDEYDNMGRQITMFLMDSIRDNLEVSDVDLAEVIGERVFKGATEGLFDDQGEQFAKVFLQSYREAIEAGFTDAEIANIFKQSGLPTLELDQMGDLLAQQLLQSIKEAFGNENLSTFFVDLDTGEVFEDVNEMWSNLDLTTLKLIYDLSNAGAEFMTIDQMMINSGGDIDVLKQKLMEYAEELGHVEDGQEGAAKSLSDLVKAADASIKDIQALDAAIKDIKENKDDYNVGDLLKLAETHSELWTVIGDTEKLLETLKKIRDEASSDQRNTIRDMIMSQEGAMTGSKYADSGYATLKDYRDSLTDPKAIADFDAEVEKMIDGWQQANENAKKVAKETKEEAKATEKAFSSTVKEVETLNNTIAKLQSGKKVDFSDIINLSTAHPEIVAFANDADALLSILQKLKAEAKADARETVKKIMMDDEGFYQKSKYYDPQFDTMRKYIVMLQDTGGNWEEVARYVDQSAADIVNAAEKTEGAAESWLEAQAKIAEINEKVNWAKSNNFAEQISALNTAIETDGIEGAIKLFDGWETEMKDAIKQTYPDFIKYLGNARAKLDENGKAMKDVTDETNGLKNALSTAQKLNSIKYFTDSAKAIKQLREGTISASAAYETFNKDINKVNKAYEDILETQAKMDHNDKQTDESKKKNIESGDVTNLANLLNMTTDQVLADFPGAIDMFEQLVGASGELEAALDMLNQAAFVKITGVSEADFSNLEDGLFAVRSDALETIEALKATGQWEVSDPIELPQDAKVWDPFAKAWINSKSVAHATVLKPTGNNQFSKQSVVNNKSTDKGSKGGGGGGSNKDKNNNFRDSNVSTEVERMLDLMSQVNTIQQSQQNYYQSQQKYYTQTGQLQGTIAYMQKEKEVLEAQNPVLEENIKRIERYMEAKKAEIATLSADDEAYKDVADDLDKLQKAHQTYTKQLIDNKTSIDALNKSMDEQRKKIRQMEIDLRNTILKAIEDRENKRTDMLNAEIEMENTILDLIKKRYERERDEIVETTNLKINALKEERDLLDEQLRIRKEQAEAEDKQLKLRELEAKYQRIIADPTRRKEAQSIKSEIDALRKEMAWDLAEEEVKAQQDAIDQQITSLEDYVEYVQNYYEDLFEHPQKLIAEMKVVISMTHDDMVNWMKENDDAYKNSSENTQQQMVEGWNSTYNEMKGILETYWEEVEEIIAQGDDYIIEFLKNNASEYASAGRLQAEAYVDEWKKQLEDLHKAYQTVTAEVAANYQTIQQYTGDSSGSSSKSSGGGSGGSSSKGGNNKKTYYAGSDAEPYSTLSLLTDEVHGYSFTFNGTKYQAGDFATKAEAESAAQKKIDKLAGELMGRGVDAATIAQYKRNAKISAYATGGLATHTGLAWLDGTEQLPERILSPHQTELFETMVEALDRMSRITVSSMPNFGGLQTTGANPVNVGDIIVNVDNLDTEDDYEELAEKVKQILMDEIGRAAVVGGLRIRST